MVLEKLSSSLKNSLAKIAKSVFVDERIVNELIKDIQRALLQADVNVKLVFELSNRIKERALKEKPPVGLSQKEYLIKVVYDELTLFMGGEKNEVKIEKKPFKILLVGLFGSGKTTTAAKLAKYFKKRGNKVALLGTDTWRPAALKQLKVLGQEIDVPVWGDENEKDPVKILKLFENKFNDYDIVIVDSAGRDALNDELVEEIERLNSALKPDETLLVMSADIGQAAQKQAEQFNKSCGVTGVIITKMDGTAKGGGALSACSVTKAPIKFIGTGEKIDDIEQFNPKGFVGRLLGMGDLEALLEKATEVIDEDFAKDLGKKFLKGNFNFIDLYEQIVAMSKMGPLTKVMNLIPGISNLNIPKEMIENQEHKVKLWKIIMQSMTKEELENPDLLNPPRIERIAKGAGVSVAEVRGLIKQYRTSKKLMKHVKSSGPDADKLMKHFKKGNIRKF
ncbi:signal recognition particle protein [Candidatus Woesearchaeota archaeon]|nr:MAG: signal recognition particle protein [Candidatus Woesearchaeota archaeon]